MGEADPSKSPQRGDFKNSSIPPLEGTREVESLGEVEGPREVESLGEVEGPEGDRVWERSRAREVEAGEVSKPYYNTANPDTYKLIIEFRKELKDNPTEAEKLLWEYLRNKKTGYKIRRQHIINDFITDFVCLRKQLVIEVDGGIHEKQKVYDELRTSVLNELGYNVVRFTNEEVFENPQGVANKIKEILDNIESTDPTKSPQRGDFKNSSIPPLEGPREVESLGEVDLTESADPTKSPLRGDFKISSIPPLEGPREVERPREVEGTREVERPREVDLTESADPIKSPLRGDFKISSIPPLEGRGRSRDQERSRERGRCESLERGRSY